MSTNTCTNGSSRLNTHSVSLTRTRKLGGPQQFCCCRLSVFVIVLPQSFPDDDNKHKKDDEDENTEANYESND